MNKISLSVIICTHNPRNDYLDRVLQALKSQTLPVTQWEILLIDNVSDQPLAENIDLNWHPNVWCIREEQLGLTPARLRGIREAKANILVYVDDDNVLDQDYLENVIKIGQKWPMIGAWGGRVRPEFEVPPPEWTKRYWKDLAIRDFDKDRWSNLSDQHQTAPCGAGLCIRKTVAEKYLKNISSDPRRVQLDRKGNLLSSCGDLDLVFSAYDIGLGTGKFTTLKLTHLIPSWRLEESYLLRLEEGISCSKTILNYLRNKQPLVQPNWKYKLYQFFARWLMSARDRRFFDAKYRGTTIAYKTIADWES